MTHTCSPCLIRSFCSRGASSIVASVIIETSVPLICAAQLERIRLLNTAGRDRQARQASEAGGSMRQQGRGAVMVGAADHVGDDNPV